MTSGKAAASGAIGLIALLLLLIVSSSLSTAATPPQLSWIKSFGSDSEAYGMVAVSDGYVLVGDTQGPTSNGGEDVFLVKADLNGNLVWSRTFGGKEWDTGYGIATAGDGFVVAGVTQSFGNADSGDFYLIRTDWNGDLVWNKTFGGKSSQQYAYGVITVPDGYVVAGKARDDFAYYRVYVVKTDLDGNLVWEKTYDLGSSSAGLAIAADDDGYVVTGSAADGLLILKIGPAGNLVWQSNTAINAGGYAIAVDSDGYVVAGDGYRSTGSISDDVLVKVDKSGRLVWKQYYAGTGYNQARGLAVLPDGYVIAGSNAPDVSNVVYNVTLIRTDRSGNLVWNATYGGMGSDHGNAIAVVAGSYVIAGKSESAGNGMLLLKTSSGASPDTLPATATPASSELPGSDYSSYCCPMVIMLLLVVAGVVVLAYLKK